MKGPRLLATAVAALLPAIALGQAGAPPAAPAAQPATARSATPQAAAADKKPVDTELSLQARLFFTTLLQKDVETLAPMCRPPFYFESQPVSSAEELKQRWSAMLLSKTLDDTLLLGMEIMTPEEMTERYGKPPEKLAAWPLKGGMVSVANVDGHAVVVLWKKNGNAWQAVAFHD